ncbi:hypothetical protein LSTR_LSTR007245 [Laodelphax striatellus]|uniref:Protein inhibitor of activated STAT n=1 Tax=Laodelphax striatellus TaxID=195883 RepID=A0A482XEM2_LAOST|nr:hypothetical protein LSTR_LSTR007245 [Laodelphax striatellus]WJZ52880.1 E3 SUMO-protein ligase PIAS2 [Laodelphax striatellus]
MAGIDELKNMLMTFRVSELQMLLGYAGRNKSGRKTELQARAVELLRLKSTPIQLKIRELYKTIQSSLGAGQPPGEPPTGVVVPQGAAGVVAPMMAAAQQQQQQQQRNARIGMAANPPSYPVYPQQRDMSMYQPSMYQGYSQKVTPTPPPPHPVHPSYPVHPDVRLKKLPFFDLLYELMRPSSLVPSVNSSRMNDHQFTFHLSPSQATEIAMSKNTSAVQKNEYVVQVQMRFCLVETSCEQEDCFPPGLIVKVNGKMCPLPNPIPTNKQGVEPKRPPKPVNITNLVKLSPTVGNVVAVTWAAEYGRQYAAAITIVRKLTSAQLLQRLRSKGIRHADFTTGLIKEKLSEDNDIELTTSSLRVSLMCPLGKMRMQTPCRSSICSHLQCFDASVFLQMNERKPTWVCPVCDKPCPYDSLSIDGYFQDMLNSSRLPSDAKEVTLHQDGTWSTSSAAKEDVRRVLNSPVAVEELISVEIDDDDDADTPLSSSCSKDAAAATKSETSDPKPAKRKEEFVDLTLSDSDSDDSVTPTSVTASGQAAAASKPAPADAAAPAPPPPPPFYNRLLSTDSNSSVGAGGGGRSSVTSSGYISPNIINLDSPSPPPASNSPVTSSAPAPTPSLLATPLTSQATPPPPAQPINTGLYSLPASMSNFFDLERDSNSPLFTPHY